MKRLETLAIALVIPALGLAQTKYNIRGSVPTGHKATLAVMSYPKDDKGGEYKADTAAIVNGKFQFKGTIGRPQLAELNLIVPRPAGDKSRSRQGEEGSNNMKNVGLFYLEETIDVIFDTAGMAAYRGGGKEQEAWQFYAKEAVERSKAPNADAGMGLYEQLVSDMVKRYPDAYVSVDLMDLFTQSAIQPQLVGPMYNTLSKRMQQSEKVVRWKPRLDRAIQAASGTMTAPDFTMNDVDGKPVSLSAYKGGYVLVDFWASWCVPCRAENPNVLAAYEKFKDKGFKVLGVSLDEKKDRWLKAIAEDKLPGNSFVTLKRRKAR
ncbi:AhpC/TSA family protein [Chitinophaga sedimenti]|uniref:TlpA disulfide reductase family protein n=1 Tax=Chitinophaga sedimenti TaxID=2033606 RepID=UPI002006A7CB|nr:TlpA disulfide reductase family protein [Chitinophaga sedimenti]MCK7556359.1 AhpC/TSA family protein [Chitinophaga sedimenti]